MHMTAQRSPSLAHWGAFTAVVEDGRLVACEPFALDPAPPRMLDTIPAMVHSPLRIARPAVREGWLKRRERSGRGRERFIEVSWDEALGLVAGELARVRAEHGASAIFGGSQGWSSAGRLHHARTLVRRFLFSGGGCVDQIGNYSWGAAQFFLPYVIGTFEPVTGKGTCWNSICHHTKLVLAFGGLPLKNGQVSSGGVAEHNMGEWLRKARAAGVEFVVVSPAASDAPPFLGAEQIAIRPNTDTAFMAALAHWLIRNDRHDREFLARHCVGFEQLRAYLTGETDGVPKDAAWASAITGVPAHTIENLARRLPDTRSLITLTYSLQRAHRGEQPYWMAIALAAMLGHIGLPGGGFGFGHGSMHGISNPRPQGIATPEMSMGKNPARRQIPAARMADLLLEGGKSYDFNGERHEYPEIRLVYWGGGNPFHHHQDLNRLERGWAKPETIVVHEPWWTPTARRADIVFPSTTMVERYDVGAGSRDRFIIAMHRAIAPVGGARNDFDTLAELAERLGHREAFTEGLDERQWVRRLYDDARRKNVAAGVELPSFEVFWEQGHVEIPAPAQELVSFEAFRTDPERNPLKTPSGRIELYSQRIADIGYADMAPHPMWLQPREWLGAPDAGRFPLHLLSVQPPHRLHSQMDPGPVSQAHKIAGREPIRLSTADAASRGVRAGDVVRVFNDRGACLAGAAIDPGLMPGVAVMSTGAWYDPVQTNGASLELHGNPNVLARDEGTSTLTQGPSPMSLLVEVERYAAEAPALTVLAPPEVVPA